MNTKPSILTRSIAALLAAAAFQQAHGASGTWNVDNGTNWSTAGSWAGSVIADGADFTANFVFNITADRTVTLDTPRTIGGLVFTDATTASSNWILGGTQTLTLDLTTGSPTINVTNQTATINAPLAGVDGVTTTGAGTLVLGGNNTWTGGLTISGASLTRLNNNNAAGNNAISYATGSTGRLIVTGGITINNTINIGAGITNVAARGLIEASDTNGQATVNGPINITASPTNGGIFRGGLTVGNELVLGGVITSSVQVTQREGRVVYRGGGTGYNNMGITGMAIVGANDGISTTAIPVVALSGTGTLDLTTFNQALAGVTFSATAVATVTGSTGILTLNGPVGSSGNFTHVFNGNVDLNAGTRNFTIADGTNAVDMTAGAAFSNGTLNKLGTGTLVLSGTSSANVTIGAGTVRLTGANTGATTLTAGTLVLDGTANSVTANGGTVNGIGAATTLAVNATATVAPASTLGTGTLTAGTLNFGAGASTVRMDAGAGADLIATTTLATSGGTTTFNLNQFGGALANGTYNLITYTGASPGLGGFALAPLGHATASLTDTGTAIAVQVTGNDKVIWDGTASPAWTTAATGNWKRLSDLTATDFITGDDVIFQDAPTNSSVDIAAAVTPSKVTFDNTATNYLVTGAAGITGTAGLTKNGTGTTVLRTQNDYTGATMVNGGMLELDHDATGNLVLTGTSGVSVASGATLKLSRDDGDINFSRNISGAGIVLVDPHTAAGAAVRNFLLTGTNAGFTGQLKLSPSNVGAGGLGSFRTINATANGGVTSTNLGTAAVDVDAGGQLWFTGAITNNVTITGTGYAEAAGGTPISLAGATTGGVYLGAGTAPFTYGGTGAIRMENGTLNANVTVDGTAKIGAVNGTGIISGDIGFTNAGDMLVIGGGTAAHTVTATGAVSVPRVLVNGGATAGSQTLFIGNNGTAGSISSPEIILYGSAAANGVLRMHRTDGLTFTNQSIRGGAAISADLARTFFLVNSLGAGVTLDNSTLDLSDGATGGTVRVGDTTGIMGSILNITGTSTVDVGFFSIGESVASSGGTVNQSGTSSVTFLTTLRVGNFGTNESNYNISGGSITTPTAAPGTFPYTTGGTEQVGGIYLGVDGTGKLTQSGGTITTNFLVLDNRGDTGLGTNMPTGIDTLQHNGGTLIFKNAQGLITRNLSTAVNFNGGTIQALGANPALDSNRMTVQAGGLTLDTNGANTFTLYGPLNGTGTVTLSNTGAGNGVLDVVDGGAGANITAGGTMPGGVMNAPVSIASNTTLRANRAVSSTWNGALNGVGTLTKVNTGSLTLAGSGIGFTGTANVNAGRLDVPNNFAAGTINIADGASLFGKSIHPTVNLGAATGGNVLFDPTTPGALTAGILNVTGASTVDFVTPPTGPGPWTAINFTIRTGAGTIGLANAAAYRNVPVVTETASNVTVNVTGTKNETWTGAVSAIWDSGVTANTNWNDGVSADNFFAGDTVTFPEGGSNPSVTVTPGVSPWKTSVTSATTAYTFNSTSTGIAGPGNLEKSGASTLTLVGANTYSGQTVISGGTVAGATLATSLGNSAVTNTIALSGGGRLSDTGAVALDLGPNRNITVGAGGGTLSHNNATAATITVPGKLTGSGTDNLSFHSQAAGAGTFVLTGDNSGYTGNISVDAQGTGITVLRFGNQVAVPAGGSITLNYPAAGANANATTLDLAHMSLPSSVTLNMTAQTNGATSLRTQVVGTGQMRIDGPITMTGNGLAVAQFAPTAGLITINGNISEATPGSFGVAGTPATVFFRQAGNTIINGTINLPNANVIRVDNTGITTINSTGNDWNQTEVRSASTLRIGANNALDPGAVMLIGQNSDAGNSFFDLNGFNQQVAGLNYIAGNGANTRGIVNNGAGASTLTINNTGNFVFGNGGGTNPAGNITGNIAIVKNGSGSQTLAGATNTYTGDVTVNAGTLVAGGNLNSTALGNPTIAGRTVTVNNSGTALSFITNNVFGNGVGNANLPSTELNAGTTLTSTRYNVLGPVTLNGATLTQSSTDTGNFEGFQFKGAVTVGGSAVSTISTGNGKANHLDANTTFNVADATGNAAVDLLVSAPLRNQSNDFASAVGGLTKVGAGTMEISSTSTYTGTTTVNAGTLLVSGNISGSSVNVNGGTLGGGGTTGSINVLSGTIAPGASIGTLNAGAVTLAGGSTFTLEINSDAVTTDLLASTGAVSLSLATLTPSDLGAAILTTGETFTFITATGGVTGIFAGLPDGALLNVGASQYQIDYAANSVSLIAVPEPGALAALVGGAGLLLGLRRSRRVRV